MCLGDLCQILWIFVMPMLLMVWLENLPYEPDPDQDPIGPH